MKKYTVRDLIWKPMPPAVIASIGKRFGRLTVKEYKGMAPRRVPYVMCKCRCGNWTLASLVSVRHGAIKSCGCLHSEVAAATAKKHNRTHGLSKTRAYRMWRDMHTRCENPKFKFYRYYGGRGIRVCAQWTGKGGFDVFIAEMGTPKPGYTLERKDNDKGYSRDNCKWIPGKDQSKNRRHNWRVISNGAVITAIEASKLLGRCKGFVDQRLRVGGYSKEVPVPIESI